MSSLEDRTLDALIDMIYNVTWPDLLEVFRVIRMKMDSEGEDAIRAAFASAEKRFLEGPFSEHIDVRWGMNLCVHCNDDNIEKNGISYVNASGDGLEFNQCLNCRIGILYNLVTAKATMDSYVVGLGQPAQFSGMSFYWVAIGPDEMRDFRPVYEVLKNGQWSGSVSFDADFRIRYLPFENMQASVSRGSPEPWIRDIPADLQAAVAQFIEAARPQIEVALVLK